MEAGNKLSKTKLNVVGESHKTSGSKKMRKKEEAYVKRYMSDEEYPYIREHRFCTEAAQYENADPAHLRLKHKIATFREKLRRIDQRRENEEGDNTEGENKERFECVKDFIKGMRRLQKRNKHKADRMQARRMERYVTTTLKYDETKWERKPSTAGRMERYQELEEGWNREYKASKKEVRKKYGDELKGLNMPPYSEDEAPYYKDTASEERGLQMHKWAAANWNVPAVWKVGESHINQIIRHQKKLKKKVKYNIVHQNEFEQMVQNEAALPTERDREQSVSDASNIEDYSGNEDAQEGEKQEETKTKKKKKGCAPKCCIIQ